MVHAHLEYQLALPKYFLLRKAKSLRIKEERLKTKKAFYKLQKAVTEIMPGVLTSYEAELRKYAELQYELLFIARVFKTFNQISLISGQQI